MSTPNLESVILTYKISKLESTETGFLKECKKHGIADPTAGLLILCETRDQILEVLDGLGLSDIAIQTLIAHRREMANKAYLLAYGPTALFDARSTPKCNQKICIEGLTC